MLSLKKQVFFVYIMALAAVRGLGAMNVSDELSKVLTTADKTVFLSIIDGMDKKSINEPVEEGKSATLLDYALFRYDKDLIQAVVHKGACVTYKDLVQACLCAKVCAITKAEFDRDMLPFLAGTIPHYDTQLYSKACKDYYKLFRILGLQLGSFYNQDKLIAFLRDNTLDLDIQIPLKQALPDSRLCVPLAVFVAQAGYKASAMLLLGYGARFNKQLMPVFDDMQKYDVQDIAPQDRDDLDALRPLLMGTSDSFSGAMQMKASLWFILRYPWVARRLMLYAPYELLDAKAKHKRDMDWLTKEVKKYDPQTHALWAQGGAMLKNTNCDLFIKFNN